MSIQWPLVYTKMVTLMNRQKTVHQPEITGKLNSENCCFLVLESSSTENGILFCSSSYLWVFRKKTREHEWLDESSEQSDRTDWHQISCLDLHMSWCFSDWKIGPEKCFGLIFFASLNINCLIATFLCILSKNYSMGKNMPKCLCSEA